MIVVKWCSFSNTIYHIYHLIPSLLLIGTTVPRSNTQTSTYQPACGRPCNYDVASTSISCLNTAPFSPLSSSRIPAAALVTLPLLCSITFVSFALSSADKCLLIENVNQVESTSQEWTLFSLVLASLLLSKYHF